MKIKNKFFSIYILAILLPLIILTLFSVKNMNRLLMENYYVQLEHEHKFVSSLLTSITSEHNEMYNSIVSNDELINLLSTNYTEDSDKFFNDTLFFDVIKNINNKPQVFSATIYTNNKSISSLNNFVYIDDEVKNNGWYKKATKQATGFYITTTIHNEISGDAKKLSYIKTIVLPDINDFAILQINTSGNYLFNKLQGKYTEIFINVNEDQLFYKSSNLYDDLIKKYNAAKEYQIVTEEEVEGTKLLVEYFSYKPYLTDDKINALIIDKEAIARIDEITNLVLLILFFTFTCATIIIYTFTTRFTNRLEKLQVSLENSLEGNYKIADYLESKGRDEISSIFNNIKKLIIEIVNKEEQIYKSKLNEQKLLNEQQKMEFKMLSSQINPHFLYNTLETIRMNALVGGNRDVANSIKLLGKSLRYVLENTTYDTASMKKEIEYIDTYIQIQKLRFKDKIQYEANIDEDIDLKNTFILPLIIQPIVENSIIHGMGNKESINISLKISKIDVNVIFIKVYDNGMGTSYDEVKINSILQKINSIGGGNSIGLKNINKRLKIYYKSKGLNIDVDENYFSISFEIETVVKD